MSGNAFCSNRKLSTRPYKQITREFDVKQKMTELKGRIRDFNLQLKDFNIPLLVRARTSGQKTSKEIEKLHFERFHLFIFKWEGFQLSLLRKEYMESATKMTNNGQLA